MTPIGTNPQREGDRMRTPFFSRGILDFLLLPASAGNDRRR